MLFTGRALLAIALIAVIGISGFFFYRVVPSLAVQDPSLSLDMVLAGNTYDETTNTMTVGTTENCLTSETAIPATHNHPAHLVIRDVEDLIGWQVRLNYVGDKFRPFTVNYTPFTDNNTGQNVSFLNLPIDSTTSVHRDITTAASIPPAPADGSNTPQSALIGAVYVGAQNSEVSADTPLKNPPDGGGYDAPGGGVVATLNLQVVGDESGQSLLIDMDDAQPNSPGSKLVVFTGSGTADIEPGPQSLGDGAHAEAAACVLPPPIDITDHTFTNNTPLSADGLNIRLSGAVTPGIKVNAPGCNAPTISGDHATGRVDLTWGALCVDPGETVVVEITSWPPAQVNCSNWGTLGLRLSGDCDSPLP